MSEEIKQKAKEEMDEFLDEHTGKHEKDELFATLFADTVKLRKDLILNKFDSILSQAEEDFKKNCKCGKCEPDDYPLPKDFLKEPKSTLKEEVRIIIHDDIRLTTHEQADKIISLFKDTLLKEIDDQPDWDTLTKFIKNL